MPAEFNQQNSICFCNAGASAGSGNTARTQNRIYDKRKTRGYAGKQKDKTGSRELPLCCHESVDELIDFRHQACRFVAIVAHSALGVAMAVATVIAEGLRALDFLETL